MSVVGSISQIGISGSIQGLGVKGSIAESEQYEKNKTIDRTDITIDDTDITIDET